MRRLRSAISEQTAGEDGVAGEAAALLLLTKQVCLKESCLGWELMLMQPGGAEWTHGVKKCW